MRAGNKEGRKLEFFNRAAGASPVQRIGFVLAITCLLIAGIWVVDAHSYDPGRGIEDALKAAWPGSYASSEVPVAWACKGVFLGLALRYLALPFSRWVLRRPSESNPTTQERRKEKPPKALSTKTGVGGWLAFLIIGMTVLGPLLGFGRLSDDFTVVERLHPALLSLPAWSNYKLWTWVIWAASVALSVAGGVRLATGVDPAAVTFAKLAIWLSGPVASVLLGVALPVVMFGSASTEPSTFGAILGSVLVASAWTLYLSKSQRVRNTYGRKVNPS